MLADAISPPYHQELMRTPKSPNRSRRFATHLMRPRRLVAISALLAIAASILTTPWVAGAASSSPSAALAPNAVTASGEPTDAALIGFLQKHFKIPNPNLIKLGPAGDTPI